MPRGRLPSKSYKQKRTKLDEVIDNVITYMEITKGAAKYLAQKKLLSPKLGFKLEVQIELCLSLLISIIEVDRKYLQQATKNCVENLEYGKEVEKYARILVPRSNKGFQFYTDADFAAARKEEVSKKAALYKIKSGGGLSIK